VKQKTPAPLNVIVDKVLPFGVFVTIDGRRRGYIKRRQMSWAGDIDPRELVEPGQAIKAVVLETQPDAETMLLSHRDALPDPWLAFLRDHLPGDTITGTVKTLGPDAVWVQIRPGINGLIPLDELSLEPVDKPDEVVWPGDLVEAVITQLNQERHQVRLSMRRRLTQLAVVASVMKSMAGPKGDGSHPAPAGGRHAAGDGPDAALSPAEIARIGPVLVVEDQDDVREPLVRWLADHGLAADGAAGGTQALALVQKQAYRLCLVDIGLPGEDGLALIPRIQTAGEKVCVAVMSGPEWLDSRSADIAELDIAAALAKPLDLDELESFLQALGRGECPRLAARPEPAVESGAVFHLPEEGPPQATFQERLQQVLEASLPATQAEMAILFEMDPSTKAVTILVSAGHLPLNLAALYQLSQSPVEDVISELEPVITDRVSAETTRRFAKLEPLLPFESCLGLPVMAQNEVRHALFYFHRKPNVFHVYRQRDAQAMATLLAAHLERQAFDRQLLASGKLLLSGRLAAAFAHEVHNKMSAVELQGVNLRRDLDRLLTGEPPAAAGLVELRSGLDAMLHSTLQLRETVRRFQDLMRAEVQWELDVNEVVRSVRGHLPTILEEGQVSLRLNLAPDLPPVPGNSQRLHYVMINLLLNAVQHLGSKNPRERHLEVTTSFDRDRQRRPVQLRITDSGPGIHRQLWERIFQLGFSTRPEGTGLGLYIARTLLENMGGQITIERSIIGVGTTFLLAFPVARREEGRN
jgi:signal transduction histidine kinase/predicted RNA-binding protein with RPS1 domain